MIPQRLELTNFLSYRDTAVLDFTGIHLACISGLNGAGKSSLLDAITWALFGKSRSKSDDDVVNRLAALSDDTAEIKFTFTLENTPYRIIRQKRTGRSAVLEFQVAAGDDRWKPLSEGKLRETQAAIEDLLRMNYETFSNASFLLQGQADAFTTKTPNRRKEILADLLGVNRWDQYRDAAAARRRLAEGRLQLLDGQLAEIEAELAEEGERKETLAAAQAELTALAEKLALQEQLLLQLRQTESAAKQQRQLVHNLAASLERAQRALASLQETIAQRQQERDAHEAILAAAEAITASFAAWQAADSELQQWQETADAHARLQQARRPFELTVTRERSRLTQQQAELTARGEAAAAAQSEHETVSAQIAAQSGRLAALQAELDALAQQEQAWHAARAALQQLESDRALLQQQIDQLQVQAQRVGRLRQEQTAVSENAAAARDQVAALAAQVAALTAQQQQHSTALGEKDGLEAEQQRLRADMDKMRERLDRLKAETGGACPLCGQPLSDDHRQAVLTELETDGAAHARRFRANKERIVALTADVAALAQQLKRAPQLERDLQTQQQRQAQAEARLAEIAAALADWEADGAARLTKLQAAAADDAALRAARAQVQALETAAHARSARDQERQAAQKALSAAEARLAELARSIAAWETDGAAALAAVTRQLAAGDFAPEAQARLAALDADIAALGYDAAAHQAAREARQALADAPARHQQLQQAQAAVKPLEDTLADLRRRLAEQEQTIAELGAQHDAAAAQLAALAAGSANLRAVEDAVFQLREQESTRQRTVGAAQQRLAVLDDLRQRRAGLHAQKAETAQHIQRLKLLEKACGRDGVQALLIEQALPDIEDRANELLERLTGGDMRVSFGTQRQLKSRDATVETLDIHIVDHAGERPYENFSGGEQFRVNFAIRLALSQILARRAGARLQTLVVDEGFGSQDPNGRQRLVEAINTIQDDFARILVITHIDALRDAFPTRIEVTKGIAGSTIAVI